jgi:molybdopterin synthase sulfur carrier subunit
VADRDPAADPPIVAVTVRYFAAARAAAGVTEETVPVPGAVQTVDAGGKPDPVTSVGAVVAAVGRRHPGLTTVLPRCSFLLDEIAVHGPATVVRDGQVLDVLPPFAGG